MAIEVNEFQTQLTDELLESLDREVRDTLIEYISNVPFIQNLISPNRERAKDRPRDSQGRIIVDLAKPHVLEDMDYFRPALMHFREYGVYTKLKPNSNKNSEFYRFLKQEVHRCRYGMVRPSDGEWVTGHLYFYLNYMPITVVRLDESKTFGTRLDDFPDMWEGIYWRYHYIEQARYGGLYNDFKGGQHGAEIACRGASKAHPYDEFAYTPNGVKKWGDIEVGDVLFGDDGKPTTVIDIPFDGEDDVYEIELKDGRKVRSSKDHNWVVYRRGVKKIISTYDLFKKHKYQRAKNYRNPTGEESIYKIKLQNECIYNETETKIDPYTMGLILGDGSFRHKKINTAGFTALEKDVDEYRNYIPYKIYKESKNSKFGWRINIPNYRDVIREYGLDMLYSNEKFIPNEYIYNSVKTRKDILTGLIDSDGTIDNKGAYHISLSSKKLIENIREICISLGYGFKLGEERKTYYYNKSGVKIECKSSYPIYIYTTDVLCNLSRKRVLLKDKNTNYSKSKSSYSVIVNVNYIGKSKCKCVTVDNESGCYLINEYVPTHNSYSVAAILAKLFLLGEDDFNKSKVKANMFSYLKEYLNKDGTLDKFVNAINHCGDHTEFPSLRLKDSMSEMQWKSGFMDSENRPRGSQNEVLGLAIKDDPGKARGKRPHPYSEKVITYSGIKEWSDIKIGDTLIGDDGKPTNVIQIHEVGEQDIYKIELSDGRVIHSTLDHLWQVDILSKKVDKTTEELIDLIKSNYVYIRSCSPIESICEKDIDIVEFIDSGGNILELSIYQRLQYFKIKYDDLAYSNYLWINDLDKKEVEIISRIARSLGWGCYSGSHSVRINKCPSKSRIINIELVGREKAKCVTVDNDSHLYLIGDFVITHNSSFQAVEEFGFFPSYLDFYQTTLPNVQEGQAAAGQSYSIGTGGEENSDFTGALELIQSPSGYNIYGLPNFYDKGSNGSRKTIFFFPGYINRIGYYNKDGVSDVIGAMLSEIKYRVNLKYNSSDPMMLTRRKAETAFTLQDAIMRRSGSIFPSAELNDRINELDSNPSSYNDMYVGYLYIEDGEVKFKPDSDLQPIMEFPHKDNKKEGAVHILRMPEKDSSGKVPNGRYIAGSDVYDDDTSETLSLGSFYILDLFTDDLVFEYTGRPMFADDFYEICRRACLFYNAELNYENNKKGLFKYFSQHNSLYLLSDTLEFLADKEIIKPGTYGNKKKGVGNYGQVAPYGRRCIRDYLLKPVEMERQIEKADGSIEIEEVNIMKLHTIKYRALLQELSMWSEDLNTDRVDALAMLMLLREDRLRLAGDDGVKKSIRKDDATYLGNDDYFNRNYKNKHN